MTQLQLAGSYGLGIRAEGKHQIFRSATAVERFDARPPWDVPRMNQNIACGDLDLVRPV